MWSNPLRARLADGKAVIGATITTPSVEMAARLADMGFDFLWVEMEHSPVTLETLRHIVLATRDAPALTFARVPINELWTAKRVLDNGVTGVIFPFTTTPELARQAVAACRYPPLGERGSGAGLTTFTWPGEREYYDCADRNVMVIAMVEDAQGVEHVDEIAATEGIDVIFIGTSDLSFSLGLRGQQNDPRLHEAIEKVVAACKAHGKYAGRPGGDAESIERYQKQGFQFFQSQTELGMVKIGAESLLGPLGRLRPPRSTSRTLY